MDDAVTRAPQRDRLDGRLRRQIDRDRRIVDPMPGDELVRAPHVVRVRRVGERRAHRHHFGDLLRPALGDLAREQAAEAPAHQGHRLAVARGEVGHALLNPFDARGARAPVEALAPVLDPVPRGSQRAGEEAHAHGVRRKPGKQHHAARLGRRGDFGFRAHRTAERFGQDRQFAEQPAQRRAAGFRRRGLARQGDPLPQAFTR